MKAKEEILNNRFSVSEFKLEEGEALHKEMQELRDELSAYEDEVQVQYTSSPKHFYFCFDVTGSRSSATTSTLVSDIDEIPLYIEGINKGSR